MLAGMLWDVFINPHGQGFPITCILILDFGVWVYSEIMMANGGEIKPIEKMKKNFVLGTVITTAMVCVGGILGSWHP